MATLNIRNLPDEVHRRLRIRAAEHGRSMEAEARAILTEACAEQAATTQAEREAALRLMQARLRRLYGDRDPSSVVDQFIAERRQDWDPE
jgi:plasmid stability protein